MDDVVIRSPLEFSRLMSERYGNKIYLKREDMQKIFSFKIRGAYNKIQSLTQQQRDAGVICASAGNHAQGVAFSAKKLQIRATIVMPRTTPPIKVDAVRRFGAEVILHGDSYADAESRCLDVMAHSGATFIHPFDDEDVIAGQGRIGLEILDQLPNVDYVFVPIGGGGLMAGVASLIRFFRPEVKVVGVEPVDSNAMHQSLAKGERVVLKDVGLFADGVAVKQVGVNTFRLLQGLAPETILVGTDAIASAIKTVFQDTRSIMEPAGALAVAGLIAYCEQKGLQGKNLAAICSGANMNFERLGYIAERTLVGEKNEVLFAVQFPEKPGSLKALCQDVIGERNITEFNYRYDDHSRATIFLGMAIEHQREKVQFVEDLTEKGYTFFDLTEDDLAKDHIRHLVGGRPGRRMSEKFYRFEFPERPQALMDFLNAMQPDWNITLFHYRSHGGFFGRVFVGFEIPRQDEESFQNFLDSLHYHYLPETANKAVELFLR